MINLVDMMMRAGADNQAAVQAIARQLGIAPEQARTGIEALMPAFSEGLRRNVQSPADFARFMQALASGNHTRYFERPEAALRPEGIAEGNAILGHLFGTPDVSRAVAGQAALMSGLSGTILKQMLPILAPIVLGGLFKQMTGGLGSSGGGSSNPLGRILEGLMGAGGGASRGGAGDNPLGRIFEEMMGGGARRGSVPGSAPQSGMDDDRRDTRERPEGGMFGDNPLGRMFEEMLGGGRESGRTAGGRGQPVPGSDNPLGQIFEDMMRGGRRDEPADRDRDGYRDGSRDGRMDEPRRGRSERDMRDDEPRESRRGGGLSDIFGEMFNSGTRATQDYQRGMESIFDQMLGNRRR